MNLVKQLGPDADADAIHALLHDAFAYMADRIDPPSSLLRLTAQGIREFAQQNILLAIFGADKTPLACLFVTVKPDHIYLGKWAVHPDHRGQGYAKALLDWVETNAGQAQYLELETRIELVENHAYFARQGFVITAETRHPGYTRTTGLTMRKTLSA